MVILVMATGCGDARGTSSVSSTTIAPIWELTIPQVEVGPPDPMLLPSPMPGVTITNVETPADDVIAPDMGPDQSAQTLWADPAVADPLRGGVLLVGRTELSDIDGGFALEGRPVDVGAVKAEIGRRGPLVIVTWPLPVTECACDQAVVVAGRNLSEDQVLRAARGAHASENRPSIDPGALPGGLQSLGTLPGLGLDDEWSTTSAKVWLLARSTAVELRIVDGDERLPIHLQFWIDDHTALEHEGGNSPVSVSTVEGHMVLARTYTLDGREGDTALLDAVPDSLHEVGAQELRAARQRAVERPVDAADRCQSAGSAGGNSATFAGSIDGERWSTTLSADEAGYRSCQGGSHGPSGGLAGPLPPPAAADEVRLLGGAGFSANGKSLHIVSGDVPEAAAEVTVTVGDLPPIQAQIANHGPAPDRKWFAAAQAEDAPPGQVTVIARNLDGEPIAQSSP